MLGRSIPAAAPVRTWPHWPRTEGWRVNAKRILEREALLQNGPDGVNREQAISYQQFVFAFLLFPLLAGQANGADFSLAYKSRMESMLEYLASVMDVGGNVPSIGDADDALVVRFDPREDFCPYRSLLATGALHTLVVQVSMITLRVQGSLAGRTSVSLIATASMFPLAKRSWNSARASCGGRRTSMRSKAAPGVLATKWPTCPLG